MSVKSLQKQLLAAIAMVVVAAIAMSSATFAWFVNNAQVTATNVSVKASTAYSLLISHTKDEKTAAWGTTTGLTKELTTLTPVSTIGEVADDTIKLSPAAESDTKADIGIGDGTTVAKGDVRFVTNTKWESNYVTGVSEVSKTSAVGTATNGTSNTYFYSENFYLKAAQAGDIYLDSTGIGINWAKWNDTAGKTDDAALVSLADFMKLTTIGTKAAADYDAQLTSAQALLKTLRVGLLVTNTSVSNDTPIWHEYQLATDSLTYTANTTKGESSGADGISKAVSALDSSKAVATNSDPVVTNISNAKTMIDTTIEDYAIKGSATSMTAVASNSTADKIASVKANEVVEVDLYVWMEGCDEDTIAANITSFSGTGVSGLQLGFCLGETTTAGTASNG